MAGIWLVQLVSVPPVIPQRMLYDAVRDVANKTNLSGNRWMDRMTSQGNAKSGGLMYNIDKKEI